MLGLALRQLLEAMCYPAQSPPAAPRRKLLEKAALAAPTGTASALCTTSLPGFWPGIRCPKTWLDTWQSRGVRSLPPQRGLTETARGVPRGGKPPTTREGAGGDMGWVMPLRYFSFLFPLDVNKGRKGTVTAGRKAGWCSALRWLLAHQLLEVVVSA